MYDLECDTYICMSYVYAYIQRDVRIQNHVLQTMPMCIKRCTYTVLYIIHQNTRTYFDVHCHLVCTGIKNKINETFNTITITTLVRK